MNTLPIMLALLLATPVPRAAASIQSHDLRAANDDDKRYFLITPADPKPPEPGHPLLLILPGGDGSADFNPFCQRIAEHALPNRYLVAQLVSKKWNNNQQIIWATAANRVPNQKFTTEQFIDAVIKDVKSKHQLDDQRIHALAWSSGGPALYAATLKKDSPIRGAFIAMSVFNPRFLPPLDGAKGKAFYIFHSPDDQVCPMRMAEAASKELAAKGAKTTLVKYPGGHGWHGPLFQHIRIGIDWLEEQS
jgi:predicted esterase